MRKRWNEIVNAFKKNPPEPKPHLGYATTQELLEELAVRMEITQNNDDGKEFGRACREALFFLPQDVLDYRTVDIA